MPKDPPSVRISHRVADLLRQERERQGLSMTATAAKAGLSQQSLSYVERYLRNPSLDTLLRITSALGIELGPIVQAAEQEIKGKLDE